MFGVVGPLSGHSTGPTATRSPPSNPTDAASCSCEAPRGLGATSVSASTTTEFRVDKWWPGIPLVGEADGALKYSGDKDVGALWQEKLRQEWFEDVLGLSVFRYVDREVRLNPDGLFERFTRRAEKASARRWTPPARLEVFQRPPPNSDQPRKWLKHRDEPTEQDLA